MSRWLGWIAIGLMLLVCALALARYGNPASHLTLDQRARVVALGLRCPVCQGESVADSPSDIARAMRSEIRRRLLAGQSENQIRAFFVSRYGDWILLAPPVSGAGTVAWLAPPLLLIAGAALLIALALQWRTGGRPVSEAGPDAYLARVRAERTSRVPD